MKNILLTGSIAYDHLMSFDGRFKDSLIPEKLDNLSLSLFASDHEVFFGGCAANIAYSLKLLDDNPVILGVAGNDFQRYADWLLTCGIAVDNIYLDQDSPTASANILTDNSQNQLTIFSPGAMKNHNVELKLKSSLNFDLALISPEMPVRMSYFGTYFNELNIPYIFDPGQALPAITKESLVKLVDGSVGLIMNEYEAEMLIGKMGKSLEELAAEIGFVVKTCGERGAELYVGSEMMVIDPVLGLKVVDSTGCGDSFRAGFIYNFVRGKTLTQCCELGAKTAAATLTVKGTQNHKFSLGEI